MKSNAIKKFFSKTEGYILLIVIVYCIIVAAVNPNFMTPGNFLDLIRSSSWYWILGFGVLLVLLSGGIDVSYTAIAICSGYVSACVIQRTGIENLAFAFFIAILIGLWFGAINGFLIHYFRLPTLIATLGTKTIFIGIMAALVGVEAINTDHLPAVFKDFGLAKLFTVPTETGAEYGLSVFFIPLVILGILTWFILYRTQIGRSVVALGNSEVSAERAGYNLFKTRMFIYMYVGALAAVAGVIAISDVAWIAPLSSTMIRGTELTIIAALIIGGVKLTGGEGTVFASIIGLLLVRLFETTLIFLGLTSSWQNFFTGLVFVASLSVTSLQRARKRRRMLLFEE
ncbi:MAG TPA: ABC transporter permease [Clostridiales bacterium]|nr:ABC transporter permease [Clostridiales bacterium]